MNQSQSKNPRAFSIKKISVSQAHTVLKQNGIQIDEDQAKAILDFLYIIAKTYSVADPEKGE